MHDFEVIFVDDIRTALQHATADFAIVEASEALCSSSESDHLLEPLAQGRADAVFVAGRLKAFRISLVRTIPLRSHGAAVASELALKLRQRGACIHEVSPGAASVSFGDVFAFARFGLRRDVYLDDGARILDALAQTPRFNRWMASVVSAYLGDSVLEIGAGIGNLTVQLAPSRRHYIASDFDSEHLRG